MTGLEGWHNTERQNFEQGNQGEAVSLSRSVQDFYQPAERKQNVESLPWALDFGTGADLYQSAAYTGGRLSASALMTDEVEQKPEATKIRRPSDAAAEAGVISGQTNQVEHDKAFKLAHAADRTPYLADAAENLEASGHKAVSHRDLIKSYNPNADQDAQFKRIHEQIIQIKQHHPLFRAD